MTRVAFEHICSLQYIYGIFLLRKKQPSVRSKNIYNKKTIQGVEVSNRKLDDEMSNYQLKQVGGRSRENNIIHIQKKICSGNDNLHNEKRWVYATLFETDTCGMLSKVMVLGPGSLFQAVQRFLKEKNMIRELGVMEPERLVHVNCFLKVAVKEGNFHKQLVNGPLARNYKTKYSTNCYRFNNRTKGLITIHSCLLALSVGNKSCILEIKGTVCMKFMMKKPH